MGRYLLVDGPLHCYLKKLRIKSIRFTPTRMDGYVRVDRAEGHGFVDLSFLIHDQRPVMRSEHCVETYRLSVCLGDVRFEPDLNLVWIPVSLTVSWRRTIHIGTERCWTCPPTCWIRNPYRLLSVGRHVGWLTETSGLLPPPLEGASGVPVRPTLQGW